jgi:hypothetical protein
MRATRSPSRLRLLAIPVVAAVVVLGLWVTGGLITNDFGVSMWLTAGWMALSGLICLVVAVRSRALRWPVLGAYAVTAAIAGVYLGSSVFMDSVVDEDVAVAPAAPAAPDRSRGEARPAPAAPRNVRARTGRFRPVRHPGRVLTLTGFDVDNGPDLRVYLVAGPARTEAEVTDFVDLGALKGNKGDQQYEIPRRVDGARYTTAVIWCRAFSVLFARAPMRG